MGKPAATSATGSAAAAGIPDVATLFARALFEPENDADQTHQRILDAALVEFGAAGLKGATVDAIAQRAEVARITVFRRFKSKDGLLEQLVLRELRTFLSEVDTRMKALTSPAERTIEAFVTCVNVAASHPLISRLEPGVALEHLGTGNPSAMELGINYVAAWVRQDRLAAGQDPSDAEDVADVLVRLALTYMVLPSTVHDFSDADTARAYARRMLVPVVEPRR